MKFKWEVISKKEWLWDNLDGAEVTVTFDISHLYEN